MCTCHFMNFEKGNEILCTAKQTKKGGLGSYILRQNYVLDLWGAGPPEKNTGSRTGHFVPRLNDTLEMGFEY